MNGLQTEWLYKQTDNVKWPNGLQERLSPALFTLQLTNEKFQLKPRTLTFLKTTLTAVCICEQLGRHSDPS